MKSFYIYICFVFLFISCNHKVKRFYYEKTKVVTRQLKSSDKFLQVEIHAKGEEKDIYYLEIDSTFMIMKFSNLLEDEVFGVTKMDIINNTYQNTNYIPINNSEQVLLKKAVVKTKKYEYFAVYVDKIIGWVY